MGRYGARSSWSSPRPGCRRRRHGECRSAGRRTRRAATARSSRSRPGPGPATTAVGHGSRGLPPPGGTRSRMRPVPPLPWRERYAPRPGPDTHTPRWELGAGAGDAGVSGERIEKGFVTKAGLAKAVLDLVIAGADEPVPMSARPAVHAIRQERDVRRKIAMFAEGLAQRQARSAGVQI